MRRLIKRIIRGTRFRIRRLAISVANFVLPRLPTRAVLGIVYLAQALHLPGQYTLLGHLISNATARQKHKPDSPLDILSAIHELKPFSRTDAMALLMARTFFELGEFERAHAMLTNSDGRDAVDLDPPAAHLQGLLELCAGNESGAEIPLRIATADMPHLMAPHQNLAARDPSDYDPTPLDDAAGPDGRLFDAYNFLGQRVTHVGMGQLSTELYARALSAQKRLQRSTPPVSPACTSYLADLGISLSNVKIFASEWQTQIGHEGMLDIELRMRELGWWKGEPIVLVSSDRVANSAFLSLFEHHVRLLQLDSGVPHDIARELSSLQRYYGMSFNAFEMPDGMVVQWSEAAASAIRQWDEEGRQPPLRVEFDRRFASSEALTATLEEARRSWGMTPDDWYVCLHLRDGSFYGEARGLGQSHRNSDIENYRAAIEYITGLGGWVIKLGAKDSPKLPSMPRVIDYARSSYKSGLMDLSLIRGARLFIGTTSGLTNVPISFGIPAALVNCISTDAQLWHRLVRFTTKQIILKNGRAVAQTELTRSPWRWRVFDAGVLARHGATLVDNTSDEILETVKEVMALTTGKNDDYTVSVGAADDLYSRWQENLSMPHYYGGAQISLYYLKKHQASLFAPMREVSEATQN
jgi:putative glycosyltransferase (TIGR04372 family)